MTYLSSIARRTRRSLQFVRRAAASMSNTASSSLSNGAPAVPPLSDKTLAELSSDTVGAIWNELLVLSSQPGVCNLGQGFPDYAGSRVAREGAAAAMVEPDMVCVALLVGQAEYLPCFVLYTL